MSKLLLFVFCTALCHHELPKGYFLMVNEMDEYAITRMDYKPLHLTKDQLGKDIYLMVKTPTNSIYNNIEDNFKLSNFVIEKIKKAIENYSKSLDIPQETAQAWLEVNGFIKTNPEFEYEVY